MGEKVPSSTRIEVAAPASGANARVCAFPSCARPTPPASSPSSSPLTE